MSIKLEVVKEVYRREYEKLSKDHKEVFESEKRRIETIIRQELIDLNEKEKDKILERLSLTSADINKKTYLESINLVLGRDKYGIVVGRAEDGIKIFNFYIQLFKVELIEQYLLTNYSIVVDCNNNGEIIFVRK